MTYGWTPNNYDGWAFYETGGGGAVTIPYSVVQRELLIGVIEQSRVNQPGVVLNVPEGFLDPEEGHLAAAKREVSEETALLHVSIEELYGQPMNPNSAFFDTSEPQTGVRVFGLELPAQWLTRDGSHWIVKPEHVDASEVASLAKMREQIGRMSFLSWIDAAQLGDMFTVAAVARLLATLSARGAFALG